MPMIVTTIMSSVSVKPRVLRIDSPFLSSGCYGAKAGAAKGGDRRLLSGTERRRAGQYSVREFTGRLGALTFACLLAVAPLARAQGARPSDSASAWYERGLAQRDQKNCRAALADFGRAIELQPDHFQALYQRGNCLQVLGEHARAVADYSRAVELPGRIDARSVSYTHLR